MIEVEQMQNFKKKVRKVLLLIAVLCGIFAFATNMHYSYTDSNHANFYTALAGWIGFLATAMIGIITLWQNKIYEQRGYIQYHTDLIIKAKELIHTDALSFSNSSTIFDVGVMAKFSYESTTLLYKEYGAIMSLSNQCRCYIHNVYNIRYHFSGIDVLFDKLCDFTNCMKKLIRKPQINDVYEKCCELYDNVQQCYFDLLVEVENEVQKILGLRTDYKKFEEEIHALEDYDLQKEKFRELLDKYSKVR